MECETIKSEVGELDNKEKKLEGENEKGEKESSEGCKFAYFTTRKMESKTPSVPDEGQMELIFLAQCDVERRTWLMTIE